MYAVNKGNQHFQDWFVFNFVLALAKYNTFIPAIMIHSIVYPSIQEAFHTQITSHWDKNSLWIIWVKDESWDSDKREKKMGHKPANRIQITLQNVISAEHHITLMF